MRQNGAAVRREMSARETMKIRGLFTQKAEKVNSRLISIASVSTTGSLISELRGTLVVKTVARHGAKVVTGEATNTAVRPRVAVLSSTRRGYQDLRMEVPSFAIVVRRGSTKRPVRSLCKASQSSYPHSPLLYPVLPRTRQPYGVLRSWRDGPKTVTAQLPHNDQTCSTGGSDACEEPPMHPQYSYELFRPLKL